MTRQHNGFTLMEIIIATALMVVMMLVISSVYRNIQRASVAMQTRETLNQEGRVSMDSLQQAIRLADPDTLQIQSMGVPVMPYSQLNFTMNNRRRVRIYWQIAQPSGERHLLIDTETAATSGVYATRVISRNLASIIFTSATNDPYGIRVSLRLEKVLAQKTENFFLANQLIQAGNMKT